jgi:uncharacterized membrane protein
MVSTAVGSTDASPSTIAAPPVRHPAVEALARRLISVIPIVLFLFWLLGVNPKEVARVSLCLVLVYLAVRGKQAMAGTAHPLVLRLCSVFPWVFVPLIAVHQLARVYLGEHGIDFAVFTQVLRSIRDTGLPMTSLVAPEPVNFFSHHFSPFLLLLGGLSKFSFEPHVIGILWQAASVGFAVFFFYGFCVSVGFSRSMAGVSSALLCINPCFRSGISWGIHDEVFALGFVGAAFYFWSRQLFVASVASILALGLFKETFFIAGALGAFLAAVFETRRRGRLDRVTVLYSLVALTMATAALFYFVVIPLFPTTFKMSFNPSSRLPALENLLTPSFLWAKLRYLGAILLPVLGLPLLSRAGLCIWMCAVPFWGASLISTFDEMHKAYNYYAVIPTYVAFFASAATLRNRFSQFVSIPPVILALCTCFAFSSGYNAGAVRPVLSLMKQEPIYPGSLNFIPADRSVVASEFDSVFVLEKRQVVRLWIAERVPTSWDVVLVRKNSKEMPSARMLEGTVRCFEDSRWEVFCRGGTTLEGPLSASSRDPGAKKKPKRRQNRPVVGEP